MKILLVVYDNDSYIHVFPMGVGYIASALRYEGHHVDIYNQDVNHYPDEHLTTYLDNNIYDLIGIGLIAGYYQYLKLLKLSKAIDKTKNRPFYVIGGYGPSPEPEYFLKKTKADAVVIGEGERTIADLVDAVGNKRTLDNIDGIAYWNGDSVIVNKHRELIKDIDSIPYPAYDLFPIEYYRLLRQEKSSNCDLIMPMMSGRGCTFKCTFCYRMDKGHRPRSNDGIIEEIKFLKKKYRINYVAFHDDLLMSSAERTLSLSEDFIKAKLNIKWRCAGRLNFARPELLKTMKRAGCIFIGYGIESMDDEVLRNMKKGLTTNQIEKGIKATLSAGISPGLFIMFGNIGDNEDTLNKAVNFLLKYDDGSELRTVRPVTPYPGSPLYYYAIEKGLLKDCEDFYENKHMNSDLLSVNFTELSDKEVYKCLLKANERLLESYFEKKKQISINNARRLYLENDASFRGFRQT